MAGTPPKVNVQQASGGGSGPSPGYDWAKGFFSSLPGVFNSPYPSQYPGQLDPGMSPTMQNVIRQAQGYGTSPQPSVLQGAQGTLGSFMSPNFINPQMRAGMGYPDYYHTDPGAPTYGGGTVGQLPGFNPVTGGGGMQGPSGALQAMLSGSAGAGMGMGSQPGGNQLSSGPAPFNPSAGGSASWPGGGQVDPGNDPMRGFDPMRGGMPPGGGGGVSIAQPGGMPLSGPGSLASYLPTGAPAGGPLGPASQVPQPTPAAPNPFLQFLARLHQHQMNHPGAGGGDMRGGIIPPGGPVRAVQGASSFSPTGAPVGASPSGPMQIQPPALFGGGGGEGLGMRHPLTPYQPSFG